MDINETLGLELSEEQIDLQVEEITRPEDPEDFEIPLRPPKGSLAIEVIGRVPSDESAPYFTKKNRLFLFFVNNSGTGNNWTEAQKQTARNRVEEAETWFRNKDTVNNIDSVLWAHYGSYESPTEYNVPFTNNCSNSWMDTVAATHGYADLEALLRAQRTSFGDDHIVALFLISEDSRSQACPYIPEWFINTKPCTYTAPVMNITAASATLDVTSVMSHTPPTERLTQTSITVNIVPLQELVVPCDQGLMLTLTTTIYAVGAWGKLAGIPIAEIAPLNWSWRRT